MSFVAELRRRNVIRMAGLYLVGAWLIVQVAGTVLPMFGAPEWVARSIVLVLAVGFIPAMMFAWIFELTPQGLKRDAEVDPEQSIAPHTARRMDRMLLAISLLAIGYFLVDKFVFDPQRDVELVQRTTVELGAIAEAEKSKARANSIAVLPFVNMSGDAVNEYFSDGISEEILNVLAGTPELQVAARTSSFSFKGKNQEIPVIAKALGVRLVLEGSVRKQGDQVRITAQLIDAQSGFHLWSETYDRKLEDIFAIQDEIAQAIGAQMKVTIAGAAVGTNHGTRNLAAYDLYLRGVSLWHGRVAKEMLDALALFEQAAEADPAFAGAYAGQALVYTVVPAYSDRYSWEESVAKTEDLAARAIALDPTLPEAYAALGNTAMNKRNLDTGSALLDRAIALRPSFATAYQWRGNLLVASGRPKEALASLEQAARLDPLSPVITDNLAFTLIALGRNDEANALCRKLLVTRPNFLACLQYVALTEHIAGNHDEALAFRESVSALQNPGNEANDRELVAALAGRGDKQAVARRLAALPFNSLVIAGSGNAMEDHVVAAEIILLGEPGLALDYLDRMSRHLGNTVDWGITMPTMDAIRCEPRFRAIVERLRTQDPRYARTCGTTGHAR